MGNGRFLTFEQTPILFKNNFLKSPGRSFLQLEKKKRTRKGLKFFIFSQKKKNFLGDLKPIFNFYLLNPYYGVVYLQKNF